MARMSRAFIISLLLIQGTEICAEHIIGGTLSYECMGYTNNDPTTNSRRFNFILKLYRDCAGTGAGFDGRAGYTVFRGSGPPYSIYLDTFVDLTLPIAYVDPPSYQCLNLPPNVCVQEGVYEFSLDLPQGAESYHISWTRCCRNQTITNVVNPRQYGATFTIEITPEAQFNCNSSPQFNSFPPTVICVNNPFAFDHSVTDKEGDRIEYELCAPFVGGGRQFNTNDCRRAVNPSPECPPPYDLLPFRNGYSASQPLGPGSAVFLDPTTGLLVGTPQDQGQYVVGVCVKEYRGNRLLSTIRRDFQFNVTYCEDRIIADVLELELDSDGVFLLNACGTNSLTIENQSIDRRFIDNHIWLVHHSDRTDSLYSWSPSITFDNSGEYPVQLILNPDAPCTDTANIIVRVVSEIEADFDVVSDSCQAGPIQFEDRSVSSSGEISTWEWQFEGKPPSMKSDPEVFYNNPGTYDVDLRIVDKFGCTHATTKTVLYYPLPSTVDAFPAGITSCPGSFEFVEIFANPLSGSYQVRMNIDDFGESMTTELSGTVPASGSYDLDVFIRSPSGCILDTVFKDYIIAQDPPAGQFLYSPQELSNISPVVTFEDQTPDARAWDWTVDGLIIGYQPQIQYTFQDTGIQKVQLIVWDGGGCADTVTQWIDVKPLATLFMPNAFSPNGDGKNETFGPGGLPIGISDYMFRIYNRWGQLVFESDDWLNHWNGKHMNSGEDELGGVYVFEISFMGPRGEEFNQRGFVTVIR